MKVQLSRVTAEVQLLRVQCEVTVITVYRSTQDDEHLCRFKVTEPVVIAGYKCSREHDYGTYRYLYYVLSKLVTRQVTDK